MTKKKVDDDLIGFRDFLDGQPQKSSPKVPNNRYSDFELITFLEQDSKRITKHIETFEEKVYMIKHYPQDIKLITDQEIQVASKKGETIELLSRKESPLYINFSEIYKSFFNS